MRYFTGNCNIDILVGEVFNITYGITFFEEGKLLDNPILNHNLFEFDSVSYNFVPNYGSIILVEDDVNKNLITKVTKCYNEMQKLVFSKYLDIIKDNCINALLDSSEGLLLTEIKQESYEKSIIFTDVKVNNSYKNYNIVWNINNSTNMKLLEFDGEYSDVDELLKSASTIIYDKNYSINLPHGSKLINFPKFTDYKLVKNNNLLLNHVKYEIHSGLLLEIVKHYGYNDNYTLQTLDPKLKVTNVLYNDIEKYLYTNLDNKVLNYSDEIKKGLFNCKPTNLNNSSELVCFITGIPIYQECYVFDIYEQTFPDLTVVSYSKPKCILVSSYFLHYVKDSIDNFQKLTQCKFLIYRVKTKVLLSDVIVKLPISNEYKLLLNSLSMNVKIEYSGILSNNYYFYYNLSNYNKVYKNKFTPMNTLLINKFLYSNNVNNKMGFISN
jgi:hypothetical protein